VDLIVTQPPSAAAFQFKNQSTSKFLPSRGIHPEPAHGTHKSLNRSTRGWRISSAAVLRKPTTNSSAQRIYPAKLLRKRET